jgi:hypothetical protein
LVVFVVMLDPEGRSLLQQQILHVLLLISAQFSLTSGLVICLLFPTPIDTAVLFTTGP